MTHRALLCLLVACAGCDGLGRPVVGERPVSDGGEEMECEVTPSCRPVRTVEPGHFDVPLARLEPPPIVDCDGDLVDDALDNCPGVPNATQLDGDCGAAEDACRRLIEGATDLTGADLRGCRPPSPVALEGDLSLRGADLSCASLSFVGDRQPGTLDVSGVTANGTTLDVSPAVPLTVDVSMTSLRDALVVVGGGARLFGDNTVLDRASVLVAPAEAAGVGGGPAVELRHSNLQASVIVEEPSVRAGRVRLDASNVGASWFRVPVLDLVDVRLITSRVNATELSVHGEEVTSTQIRTSYGVFSHAELTDVVFDTCVDLSFRHGALYDVDIPSCEPEGLRIVETEVLGARLGGGLDAEGGRIAASVLGGGESSTFRTREVDFDAVTFCDPGAGAFYGGALRCLTCDEHAFMEGTAVCLGGARIFERGCPAIELAPECGG